LVPEIKGSKKLGHFNLSRVVAFLRDDVAKSVLAFFGAVLGKYWTTEQHPPNGVCIFNFHFFEVLLSVLVLILP
jgi:hypothetical protein